MYFELTPAYGRDYKTKAEVTAAMGEIHKITRECLHNAAHLERSMAEREAARLLIGIVWAIKGNRGRAKLRAAMQYLTDTKNGC